MKRISILLLLGLLAGCASTSPASQAKLNALVGQSEADLVHQLGTPTRTYETGDHSFVAYENVQHVVIPGSGPGWGYGGTYPTFGPASYFLGDPPEIHNRDCTTTFEIGNDHVLGWSRQGAACG
jgi:hypothetical protein